MQTLNSLSKSLNVFPHWTKIVALSIFTLGILWIRRPNQFSAPYLWAEDGKYNLAGYANSGLWTLFDPVAGYHVLATKLIALLAFKISIIQAPVIALALCVAMTAAVIIAIAYSPTYLRWKPACAVFALLLPTDPEAFAVSLYAFWWAGILLVLALLWKGEEKFKLRLFFIFFGGLSSPLSLPAAPLFVLRSYFTRSHQDYIASVLAISIAIIQAVTINSTTKLHDAPSKTGILSESIGKFFGSFIAPHLNNPTGLIDAGIILLIVVGICATLVGSRIRSGILLLVGFLALIIITTSFRVDISIIHPYFAGPRYFFYPFLFLGWLLIWLAATSSAAPRTILLAIVAASISQTGERFTRYHDRINWKSHILNCAQSERYSLPVHTIGNATDVWNIELTGQQCRSMIQKSIFAGTKVKIQ